MSDVSDTRIEYLPPPPFFLDIQLDVVQVNGGKNFSQFEIIKIYGIKL